MLLHKSKILTRTALFSAAIALILVGCSDSPENKAAKELRQMTEQALQLAEKGPSLNAEGGLSDPAEDYVKARARLEGALRQGSLAPDAAGPAWLAHGNLCFAQVRHMRKKVHEINTPVSDVVDELSVMARKINEIQLRRERLRQTADAVVTETRQLTDLLEGTAEQQGIRAKRTQAEAQLQEFVQQRQQLLAEQQAAQDAAGDIQRRADEKLQAAELSTGEEKMALLKAAFDLMLEKKKPFVEAQQAADRIEVVDEKITLLRPTVQQLSAQVEATAKRIEELKKSSETEKTQIAVAEADEQMRKYAARVDWLVADLRKGLAACAKQAADMTELLDTAVADYQKVRTRALAATASVRVADANFWKASIAADRIIFDQHISGRLQAIAAVDLGAVSTALNEVAQEYHKVPEDTAKAVLDAYDSAAADYAAGDSGKNTMANHVLALYGKALFANRVGEYDASDAAIDAADEVLAKIKQVDPVFFTSVTAQLLNPSGEFIPPMSVDLAAQYEELKRHFQAWKQMRGDEKKAEVERLLAELNTMKPPLDPQEFERIIGPERQALEAQMARGFDEPVNANDPNSFM
ncbi:MAG: hypothetical protein IH624_11265 [Phycisphaerae bacterium]|nr:hypothetical protein [Phycisphaerae bacterium]